MKVICFIRTCGTKEVVKYLQLVLVPNRTPDSASPHMYIIGPFLGGPYRDLEKGPEKLGYTLGAVDKTLAFRTKEIVQKLVVNIVGCLGLLIQSRFLYAFQVLLFYNNSRIVGIPINGT